MEANSKVKPGHKHKNTLVKIMDYDPSRHLLKVQNAKTGEALGGSPLVKGDVKQTKQYELSTAQSMKTLPAPDGPIVEVTDSSASIRGSSDYGFHSDRESGNVIKGAVSIEAGPHEIRIAGLTTLNPLITTGFASTIMTPIPTTQWSIPGAGLLGPIMEDIMIMGSLIAAGGISA